MFNYFEDNMTNMGLPEAGMEWDSNNLTQIENKYIKN